LIVFDGIDGAGKTTQTSILAESLNRYGYDVVTSKEPTSGKWGQRLRDSAAKGRLAPGEELVLFMEDRMEHVRDLIAPSLAAGKIVVLDRYYFSTAAYQGALGMDPEKILAQNEAFAPKPDILFLLEVTPRVGLARIAGRGDVANHFEKEDNLLRCAEIFSAIDRPFLRHTDATRSIKDVGDEVLWAVCEGPIKDRLVPWKRNNLNEDMLL